MNRLINQEVRTLLTYRIQQEELSSRLYEQMSLYLNDRGYKNAAKLYKKYSEEELVHAQWSKDYLLAFGLQPELPRLDAPISEFEGLPDIFRKTLEHETQISEQCNDLAKQALAMNDFMLFQLALKYTSEQVEELQKASDLVSMQETFGEEPHTLLLFDSHLEHYI